MPMELREIVVITDGKSNIGEKPAKASGLAHSKGIIVNTIGIMDSQEGEEPFLELDSIARVGGGICDIVPLTRLDYSVQMVTRQSVQMTIEKAVSRQLEKITGYCLEEMEPASRARILEYIQKVGDEVTLKCVVLLDCSGSMRNKIKTAIDSIQELLISLKARKGKSSLGIVAFPGGGSRETRVVSGLTDNFEILSSRLKDIRVGGATPTYGGIMRASEMFNEEDPGLYAQEANAWQKMGQGMAWPDREREKPFIL